MTLAAARSSSERRRYRRHQLDHLSANGVVVERTDPDAPVAFVGGIVDLSAGGVRVRTADESIRPGATIGVRLSLPEHAGIRPFTVPGADGNAAPACEWVGEFRVLRRIERADGTFDLGGQFAGMTPVDRGMLGLYLSIQPIAA